ncbi:helix-turn-helix domain-containing protein [Kitasatospora sp. NPDC090308]|uniref:helix-turn-helix domain-containing protein n=1 Tax=Kitasatospora sp. NPDC090308 TaxID=3364082 RepID=UPI0037FE82FC
MRSLYDRLEASEEGSRALAAARLRYEVLAQIHDALAETGVTQAELARRLDIRRSAVNQTFNGDGNVRVSTLAEYLHALGWELKLGRVQRGAIRQEAVSARPVDPCGADEPNEPHPPVAMTHQEWGAAPEDFAWYDYGTEEHDDKFYVLSGGAA